MMRLQLRAGRGGEIWQLRQRHVHAERAGAATIAIHAFGDVGIQVLACDQLLVQQLRIEVGDDCFCAQLATVGQLHTDRLAALAIRLVDQHALNTSISLDDHAARRAFLRDRLGNRAHAADRVAPDAGLAVDLAEDVMQQHVGRARRIWTCEISDHRIPAEYRLQRRGFEVRIQQLARRLGE